MRFTLAPSAKQDVMGSDIVEHHRVIGGKINTVIIKALTNHSSPLDAGAKTVTREMFKENVSNSAHLSLSIWMIIIQSCSERLRTFFST